MSSADPPRTQLLAPDAITLRIATVRGVRVILDTDLAVLYEVETKRFNEAVRRNLAKFPADFMLQLTAQEWAALRSQFATLNVVGRRIGEIDNRPAITPPCASPSTPRTAPAGRAG